jgi:hypothetical protein
MRALSIRQPFAELILRGIKTIEYRSRATRIVGERFWIYAPRKSVVSGQGSGERRTSNVQHPTSNIERGRADGRGLRSALDVGRWTLDVRIDLPWSRDLSVAPSTGSGQALPAWMVELAEQVRLIEPDMLLPTGVIVGSAVVDRCVPLPPTPLHPSSFCLQPFFQWHLRDIRRAQKLRPPTRRPQPMWFLPF